MKLKDAFRVQNKLPALMDEASDILQDRGNTLKVTTTHLRSKADEVSARLDQCLVNTTVDYVLPFEVNDSFDTILSDFIQRQST